MELSRAHGKTVNFVGVVFDRGHNNSHFEKQRVANLAASQVRRLGAQGVRDLVGGRRQRGDRRDAHRCRPASAGASRPWRSPSSSAGPTAPRASSSSTTCPRRSTWCRAARSRSRTTIPKVKRVAGGDVLRLRKETGGDPEPADVERTLPNTTPFYCAAQPERHRAPRGGGVLMESVGRPGRRGRHRGPLRGHLRRPCPTARP